MIFFLSLLLPMFAISAVEQEITVEEFLQKLSSVDDLMTRKDPFIQATPPFAGKEDTDVKDVSSVPIMQRYSAKDYIPIAVLLGDQYPRALVKIPGESGGTVIVKLKDKLGNHGGAVTKIERNGITIIENIKSPLGFVDKATILLPVGGIKTPTAK